VERYENTVTDKLVQNEYELLDEAGEVIPTKSNTKKANKRGATTEDDEFVII
jgi:hypothetical protein